MFGERHRFKVWEGAHYLRGYIGDDDPKCDFLRECMLTWEKNIGMIRKTVGGYSQESYATVACMIQ